VTGARHLTLLLLAAAVTLLNAVKPLTVDDSVYYHFAAHIARHPADPYGFRAWDCQPANSILAPPVLLYWWAGAVRLFGDRPFLWKLWLGPFVVLLAYVLHALGRRFARGLEAPFVFAVILSPAVLPCLNLMLDVPALALGLLAVVLFLRASDRGSVAWAVAAGAAAGLAAQTKYTGLLAPAVMLLGCHWSGRWRLGLTASGIALALFAGWEAWVACCYGDSHFLLGYRQFRAPLVHKLRLMLPLVGGVGSTALAAAFVGLAALGARGRALAAAAALSGLGFALVALTPAEAATFLRDPHSGRDYLNLGGLVFGTLGLCQWAVLGLVARRLLAPPTPTLPHKGGGRTSAPDASLVAWLVLEVAGYFALSPYPAARRLMGVAVVGSLLAVRLAARSGVSAPRLWAACLAAVPFGLFGYAIDFLLYHAEHELAQSVAAEIRRRDPHGTVWYVGKGAFEFYAERAGMKRLPSGPPYADDWIVVPEGYALDGALSALCEPCGAREWFGPVPLRSRYQFGAATWERHEGPLARVRLYRLRHPDPPGDAGRHAAPGIDQSTCLDRFSPCPSGGGRQ
jgi:hypothetical protein